NLQKPWEDVSHATITAYGIHILHEEVGYSVFTEDDFEMIANNVNKIVNDEGSSLKMRKFIHRRSGEEQEYYTKDENPYYYDVLRWGFLGVYNEDVFDTLEKVYEGINIEDMN